MKTEIHACFASKVDVIQAVESLLRHGVCEEDVTLILPYSEIEREPDKVPFLQVQSGVVAAPKHKNSAVVVSAEQGLGVALGFGLLTAICIPRMGLIAGSAAIIGGLVAAGAIIGGIAGGIHGYLIELGVPHKAAEAMADHITSGGSTLSVNAADARHTWTILETVADIGGRVIQSTN